MTPSMKKLERRMRSLQTKLSLQLFGQARGVGASLSTTIGEGSGRGSTASPLGRAGLASHYVGPSSQPSIKSVIKKSEKVEADRVMGRCLYWSHIPLSIVKNNPFWPLMCDAIAVVGPGYKSATFDVVPHFVRLFYYSTILLFEGILSQMTRLNFEIYVLIMLIHLGTHG